MSNLKAGCTPATIDANTAGLRYAEEDCPGQLPASPVWHGLDPNSYADFSASYSLVTREPITASRQLQKGTIADVDAKFGVNQDVTMGNLNDLLQGFFFATAREKPSSVNISGKVAVTISSIAGNVITLSGALNIVPGDLILLDGLAKSSNNGIFLVSSVKGTAITLDASTSVADDTAPASGASVRVVGKHGTAGSVAYTAGGMAQLAITLPDGANLGLMAGEWVYVAKQGDIGTKTQTGFSKNYGYARLHHIDAAGTATPTLNFDKFSWSPVAETASNDVALIVGTIIRNESDPSLIVQRTYQFERTLGNDANGTQAEYSVGAVANELTLNVQSAEKITADIAYISMRNEERTGQDGLKPGSRPDISYNRNGLNGTTDLARLNMSILQNGTTVPESALFSYATQMTMTINNNVNPRKAIGTLGAVSMTAGNFQVGGAITAYLTDVRAIQAIRNNSDVTIDAIIQNGNNAQIWDIPLLSLSNGAASVAKDEAITIPLDINGAESEFGYTMQYMFFPWVPKVTY